MLGQGLFNQVMQKQTVCTRGARALSQNTPASHGSSVFLLSWKRDLVLSSAWGGLCLLSSSSRTALIISPEQTRGSAGPELQSSNGSTHILDELCWHQLAGAILSCRSNFFTEKLSHLLFSIHSEFQVLILKGVSLSICAWKSWPQQLICASTIIAVKKLFIGSKPR